MAASPDSPGASHDIMFAQPARVGAELKAFLG